MGLALVAPLELTTAGILDARSQWMIRDPAAEGFLAAPPVRK
jgi:hypothetical protein